MLLLNIKPSTKVYNPRLECSQIITMVGTLTPWKSIRNTIVLTAFQYKSFFVAIKMSVLLLRSFIRYQDINGTSSNFG